MKKILPFFQFFALVILVEDGFSQVTFQKTYGGIRQERANYVQRTGDGGYIMTGWTNSFGSQTYDVYLVKTDSYGDITWAKSYGGNNYDIGKFVQQTYDGGYVIAGETHSFSSGNKQIYMLKTDGSGNLNWSKTFGGNGYDFYANSVYQTLDSGFVLAVSRGNDAEIIKTDGNGAIQWTRVFNNSPNNSSASCVKQNNNGEYIVVGATGNPSPFGCGFDILFIKLDASGNLLLQKKITCGSALSVYETADGGYILLGNVDDYFTDAYLVKIDSVGNLNWAKTYGGIDIDYAYAFVKTDDNGYFIAGMSYSFASVWRAYTFKTDSAGNVLWSNIYGLNGDGTFSIDKVPGDGYIIAGGAYDIQDSSQFYLIKTDVYGNSGCNQSNVSTTVIIPTVQVVDDTLAVTSDDTTSIVVTTVDSGGTEDTLCFAIGINEFSEGNNNILLFPNPATNELTIRSSGLGDKKIEKVEIYDVLGKQIYYEEIKVNMEKEIIVDVSKWDTGIYFVKVLGKEGVMTTRLVKE